MKYEIIKKLNDRTFTASFENNLYILKEIPFSDTGMYRSLINLDCVNVVKFFEAVAFDGKFYIVEEYINGITLKNSIDNFGCFDEEGTKQITLQICEGLKAIHRLGIVHRDVSPGNVMISSDGTVKIIDFGISRTIKENVNHDTEILGTQGFAAPEQFGFRQTNERSDIYSVGVLINYMRTGQLPAEKLTSGWLSEIVLRCTEIDEFNRYDSIDTLRDAILKKNKISHRIRLIPGFRKGVWWHGAVAVFYYTVLAFFILVSVAAGKSVPDKLLTFGFFIFFFVVPVPVIMNYNNWINRMPFIRSKTKRNKRLFQAALCILSGIVSLICIIADINL